MKLTLSFVSLAIFGSIEAGTISQPDANAQSIYFSNKLASIQGAITDTINAGMDLEVMEGKLQGIVDSSSYFFRTESATEYAVSTDAYQNGWGADSGCEDDEEALRKLDGPESCAGLVESLEYLGDSYCARDAFYGKYCRKSCGKCDWTPPARTT